MNWYYEKAGQRQGPVPEAELDRLLASGEINATTLVWSEGMANWTPLAQARPTSAGQTAAPGEAPPPGWIRCTATGKYFPPSEIVYIDGKAYSAAAKPAVLQGVMQSGVVPPGLSEERTAPAWERREQIGFVRAIWETAKGALFEPSKTFREMKRTGGLGAPYFFYLICGVAGSLFMLALLMMFVFPMIATIMNEAAKSGQKVPAIFTGGIGVIVVIVYAVMIVAMQAIVPFVASGILHLCLVMIGAARQPFETTFRTWCYAHGSGMLLMLIPVCGWAVAGVWAIVVSCIGLARAHEITTGKAVLAVLLPIGVCCLLDIGLQIVLMGIGSMQHAPR